jgi:hypothetical protein
MPTVTFGYRSAPERVAIERAVAFVAERHSLAQATPDGQVVHTGEGHRSAGAERRVPGRLGQPPRPGRLTSRKFCQAPSFLFPPVSLRLD